MAEKSKILIIGGTGYIGKFIVEASAKSGHPTFALVRESTLSDPPKAKLIDGFKSSGVTLIHGDLYDQESLVKALKHVDVVISTVGSLQISDQAKIIAAIKEAGNIKKTVVSVDLLCSKCRLKVMKLISTIEGINSIALDPSKNTVTVIGEADPVCIIKKVRKFKKSAQIVSIVPAKEEKKDKKKEAVLSLQKTCQKCDVWYVGPWTSN